MIRLTVLYKLKPEVDEEDFIKWRLTEHQTANSGIAGVIRTDFTRIDSAWPEEKDTPYRFMTTVDWPDMQSFEAGFYDPDVQQGLAKNLEMLENPVFVVGEVLVTEDKKVD